MYIPVRIADKVSTLGYGAVRWAPWGYLTASLYGHSPSLGHRMGCLDPVQLV